MDFRNEIFVYLIFVLLVVSSLARNIGQNYKSDTDETQCNDTEILFDNLWNLSPFIKYKENLTIVLTDSENIYEPLKNELLKNNSLFFPLKKTFYNDLVETRNNFITLNTARYIKFIIHSDSTDNVAFTFQHLAKNFENITDFQNSVGIALTSNNAIKKEQVVSKLYDVAKQLNKTYLLELIDRYSSPKGPPIAIFNNQSSSNQNVTIFLQDIHYISKNESLDNVKFPILETDQKKVNCATSYVHKQVMSDVKSYVENVLKPYFDDRIEEIQYSTSDNWKNILIKNFRLNVHNLSLQVEKLSKVQHPGTFIRLLGDIFSNAHTFHEEFKDTFFLKENIIVIHFLYTISDYAFATAQDKWPKSFKDSKMLNPDSLKEWYNRKERVYFETKCVAMSKGMKHQVRGTIVPLNEIEIHQCGSDTTLLEIFAVEKVLINANLTFIGREMQVVIIAPVWKVIDSITIDLSGANAEKLLENIACNGSRTGNIHGCDGKAGLPGGSAGNFIGVANRIINGNQLSILANGGKGGQGQSGGRGVDGENGHTFRDEEEFDCWTPVVEGYYVTLDEPLEIGEDDVFVINSYIVHGTEGTPGGKGGNGGAKGSGGYSGNVILFDLSKTDSNSSARIDNFDGESGTDGRGGLSGHGGKNGFSATVVCVKIKFYFVSNSRESFKINDTVPAYARSGSDGIDGKSLTSHSMPEVVAIVQNFPHTINEYKLYIRPELTKINYSKNHLLSFYELLNTRKEIIELYNTLSLVEEFTGLEQQGFDLKDQHHLIPSFTALKERIYKHYNKPNYAKESAPVYKDVMKKLYRLIIEKLETIRKEEGYPVMANIFNEFKFNGLQQIKKLEEQEIVNSKLKTLNEQIKPLDDLTEQAESFMSNNLQNAMKDLQSDFHRTINDLLEEISKLKKNVRQNEKELFEKRKELRKKILLKQLFGILKIGCTLAGLVYPPITTSALLVSSTLSIVETTVTQNDIKTKVNEIPKAVQVLSKATADYLASNEIYAERELLISNIMMNATPSGKDMINRMRENINNAFEKPDSGPMLLSNESLDQNEVYMNEEASMTNKMEEAKKNNDTEAENDCKIGLKVLKVLTVGVGVLEDMSHNLRSILDDDNKIDEINIAVKESQENLNSIKIIEKKVYNEALDILIKIIGFTDKVNDYISGRNQNELIITNWDVSKTVENVQKAIQESFDGFDTTAEMNMVLGKLVSTYEVMSKMQKQILKYREEKSKIEFVSMMHLAKERELLFVDRHLMNALAELETVLIYNDVNDFYKEWIFAFKQFSFPNVVNILKLTELPDAMIQKDVKHVIADIKTNVDKFNKLLIKESKFDNLLENRAPKLFRGSCSSDGTSFFVWRNESFGSQINNILSGKETTIVSKASKGDINALKFNKVGILFTTKNCEAHKILMDIMKNVRVNLTHHGDSAYKFNNKTFEIKTNPTILTFNYPSTVDEIIRLPSSMYKKISNGAFMLSPYATWTIKFTSDNATVFESLHKFKGQVDLELIGEGEIIENYQCDKECEADMMKYYKLVDETHN